MKTYVIRSKASVGSDLRIEAHSLDNAVTRFRDTIGLLIVKCETKRDGARLEYIEFLMGNDRAFYAYDEELSLNAGP